MPPGPAPAAQRSPHRRPPSPTNPLAEPGATGRRGRHDWKTGDVVLGLYEVAGVLARAAYRVYRVRRGWGAIWP
jgi:hypothetical protein